MTHNIKDYGAGTLPDQIRSRVCRGINGLDIHYLGQVLKTKTIHSYYCSMDFRNYLIAGEK